MRYARSPDKQLIEAARGLTGFCPGCDSPLVAKCGTIISPHWAHHARPDCDAWSEPESAWHLGWKSHAPPERTEVVMGAQREHRADVVLPDGRVLELQHSALSVDAIREREAFYTREAGGMVWLWDASRFWHSATWSWSDEVLELPRHRVLSDVGCAMYWDVPAHVVRYLGRHDIADIADLAGRLAGAEAAAADCGRALARRRVSLERCAAKRASLAPPVAATAGLGSCFDAGRGRGTLDDNTLRQIRSAGTMPEVLAYDAARRAEDKAQGLVRRAESDVWDARRRVAYAQSAIESAITVAALQATTAGGILQVSPLPIRGVFCVERFISRGRFASMIRGTP